MKWIAMMVAVMLVMPTFAQRKKKEDEEPVQVVFREGVAYTLPQTGIRVHVTAVCEKFVPGPYAAYAEKLLGIKNVRTLPTISWKIKSAQMETFSVPDPAQVHKAMGEAAALLSLTEDGCLAGINIPLSMTPENKTWSSNKTFKQPDEVDNFSFDYFTTTPAFIPGDSTNNFVDTPVQIAQKAAEAARRILDSRIYQFDIAALLMDGEYPDGKAYEVSLKELKSVEKKYTQLFVGRTIEKEESYTFDFIPTKASSKPQVVFRISEEKGLVPADDLSGKPVYLVINVDNSLMQNYQKQKASENPDAGSSGVFYRMPGMAEIKLVQDVDVLAIGRFPVAQFGEVTPLPEQYLDGNYSILLHPETGAIKAISLVR